MRAEINVSKIPVGGGVAGLLIALAVVVIGLIGIPALRPFLLGSVALGAAAAAVLRWRDR
ncbi:MAG TPA: hypothetical protein VKE70_22620 [Candidatus Solibacter sp.]|nr:hypothetical protein [Candidatus Solibacter sp.]